ncbi:ribosomal protein L7Ae-like protein [Desulfuribacillus stibiiarsenatis]|uniref:Ribosomal protein L7Ae-like protein n=1 Tax=Desulfuribacillus stibiiarsenatis TaxID=1390249 RepID=A0A1E5L843_9FIRM|nr:50S ribosomal protein L7ae-like protein [Desulfuribacillus stibiiarsenatis]OEH86320.1 ribosomal protein L7Ae-like protein [Desulfuribacillus stibiiarsenatis]
MPYLKLKDANHITIGSKQTLKAIETGVALEVLIAKDADLKVTVKIAEKCKEKNVPVIYVDSMKKLGKACGIEVGAATVAITKA